MFVLAFWWVPSGMELERGHMWTHFSLPPERYTEADTARLDIMPPSGWDVQHLPRREHQIHEAKISKTRIKGFGYWCIQVNLAAVCCQPATIGVELPATAGSIQPNILLAHHLCNHTASSRVDMDSLMITSCCLVL